MLFFCLRAVKIPLFSDFCAFGRLTAYIVCDFLKPIYDVNSFLYDRNKRPIGRVKMRQKRLSNFWQKAYILAAVRGWFWGNNSQIYECFFDKKSKNRAVQLGGNIFFWQPRLLSLLVKINKIHVKFIINSKNFWKKLRISIAKWCVLV